KKLMHSGPAAGRSDGVAGKLMADSVAYTSYWIKLMRKQAATLACQQQPSRQPHGPLAGLRYHVACAHPRTGYAHLRRPVDMTITRGKHRRAVVTAIITLCLALIGGVFASPASAAERPLIQFGVPVWPGVTVKTEVAAQLLDVMGYATKQTNASPTFIVNSMASGRLDAYLGGWLPHEAGFLLPLIDDGKLERLTTNVSNPIMGLAVPQYVWDAGVHSVADLNEHADKFGHKIYGIEPGTGVNMALKKAIENDFQNLGDWDMVASSTSGMLVQVDRAINNGEWIAFLGWEPHWMNTVYDIKYLKAVRDDSEIAHTVSNVLTVVTPQLAKNQPQATRFLTQFQISKDTMGQWILEISKKGRDADDIASQWIANNMDMVAVWLEGVETLSGESAIEA